MRILLVLVTVSLITAAAFAQQKSVPEYTDIVGGVHDWPDLSTTRPARPASRPALAVPKVSDKLSITEHEIPLRGESLRYRATAGYMPVKDESGKDRANYFFIAYEKLPQGRQTTRPVTFVFNGGPGAAAVWLHIGALGPKRIAMKDDVGNPPQPPYRLVENEATWLDLTDLVFIDPVGTGFSRPAPGENAQQFYGVREDVASVADFIRVYLNKYQRWLSPKFLAGESYGTTRAAALSQYLLDRYGISLNGIVLISSVLDFQTIEAGRGNDLGYVLYLPSFTAIAWYHRKLAPELQEGLPNTLREVEQFALNDYATALAKGDALPPAQRKAVIATLARYTSLSPALIERSNLRIPLELFRRELLGEKRQIVGRFDGRIVGYELNPAAGWGSYDPSLSGYLAAYSAAINDYIRRELHYENDLPYELLSGRVGPWNFSRSGNPGGGQGYLDVTDDLRSAMAKTPFVKVMFAAGYFDLATPYLGQRYTAEHLDLSAELRANIVQTYYRGGHMMYHNHADLVKLKDDVTRFIQNAVSEKKVE